MRFAIGIGSFFLAVAAAAAQPLWNEAYRAQLPARLAAGQAETLLNDLSREAPLHLTDPEFNYWLGVVAAAAGKKPLAMDSFERAVLINPKHAGAWLELALLHAQFGDEQTAHSILDHVMTQFDPPLDVKKRIESLRRELTKKTTAQRASVWQAEVQAGVGYVSNVNAGLSNLNFLLYLPDAAPIVARANESLKARGDSAVTLRVLAARSEVLDARDSTETIVTVGARHYLSEQAYRQADLGVWWQFQRKLLPGLDLRIRPGLRVAQQDAQTRVAVGSFLTGLGWSFDRECQSMVFVEPEWRRVSGAGVGSETLWFGAQSGCRLGRGQVGGFLRAGADRPDGQRAGGITDRLEAQISFRQPLGSWATGYEFEGSVFGARYADRGVYSPLLGENSKRVVERWVTRVGLERQLEGIPRTKVSIYYLSTQDKSWISLFSTQGEEVFVGLKRQFDF